MWKTLAQVADEDVKVTEKASSDCYETLDKAALELHRRVKALLSDYDVADGAGAGAGGQAEVGGAGLAIEQASRLLGQLCEQAPRSDGGPPPNAIRTPRAPAADRSSGHPHAAGNSASGAGANKLRGYLTAEVPSLKWENTTIPGEGRSLVSGQGQGQHQHGGAPSRRLAASQRRGAGLSLELDGLEEEGSWSLQDDRSDLQRDSQMRLRELHTDVSPIGLHHKLMHDAVKLDSLPERDSMLWYKLYTQEKAMADTRLELVALFHTSSDPTEAWARITDAFMHGLALPDAEAARLVGRLRKPGPDGAVAELIVKRWTPESYPDRFAELQKTMDKWLRELLQQRLDFDGKDDGSQSFTSGAVHAGVRGAAHAIQQGMNAAAGGDVDGEDGPGSMLEYKHQEYDFATYKLNIMPFTYLQMVGQKLLHHATLQVPCMIELPERVPDWTLRTLYARPFAEAVRLAIQSALAAANEPRGSISALVDERVAGGKQFRTLLQSRDERRKREARAKAVASRSGFGGLGGGEDAGGGGGDGEQGGGADDSESALEQARNSLGFIMYLFKDVAAFEKGFGEILSGDVLRYPKNLDGSPATNPVLPSVPAYSAAVYLSIIHDEVARVVRDMRPALRSFITNSLMSAVQACLAADNGRTPPYPVMVSYDAWPKAEFMELSDLDYVQAQIMATGGSMAAALSSHASLFSNGGAASSDGGSGTNSPQAGKARKPQPPLATAMMRSLYSRASSTSGMPSSGGANSSGGASTGNVAGGATPAGARTPGGGASLGGAGDSSVGSPPTAHSSPGDGVGSSPGTSANGHGSPGGHGYSGPNLVAVGEANNSGGGGGGGGGRDGDGDGGGGGDDGAVEVEGDDADKDAPEFIDVVSQRVLDFVAWLLSCLGQYPETVQALLAGATLECLSLLMDRLSTVCTTLHDMPRSPLPLMFLFHSAACCVRRRLESFKLGLDVLEHDEQYLALVQQHGECLVQADELVSSIHRHIVMAYKDAVHHVVLAAVDRTDWCTHRPEVMRGKAAGPAVRVWHAMMARLLHSAARFASLHAAEWIVGQVLQESLACLAQRYLLLCPSVQMLPEFVADSVHAVSTVMLLCQPIPIRAPQQRNMDAEDGGKPDAAGAQPPKTPRTATATAMAGTPRPVPIGRGSTTNFQCTMSTDTTANAAAAVAAAAEQTGGPHGLQVTRKLRVPAMMVRALAGAARELLVRAALLYVPGRRLEEVAIRLRLVTGGGGGHSGVAAAPSASTSGRSASAATAVTEESSGGSEAGSGAVARVHPEAGTSSSGGGGGGVAAAAAGVPGRSRLGGAGSPLPPISDDSSGRRPDSLPDIHAPRGGNGDTGWPSSGPGPIAEGTLQPPPAELALAPRTHSATGGPRHRLAATSVAGAPPAGAPSDGSAPPPASLPPAPPPPTAAAAIHSPHAHTPTRSGFAGRPGGFGHPTVEVPGSFNRLFSGRSIAGPYDLGTPRTAAALAEEAADAAGLLNWSSWLPSDVMVQLTSEKEAIQLSSAFFVNKHMPLGNRMADVQPAEPWKQEPPAQGDMWRRCLDYLVDNVSADQVLEALARRHELHDRTGAEPTDSQYRDSRTTVRTLAKRLGLLAGEVLD